MTTLKELKIEFGTVRYLARVPAKPRTDGLLVVHNFVRPQQLGENGFRAWLAHPRPIHAVCQCGWR